MFLVVGLAMFTTVIPEAMVLVRSLSRNSHARSVFLVNMAFAKSDPDKVVEVLMTKTCSNFSAYKALPLLLVTFTSAAAVI